MQHAGTPGIASNLQSSGIKALLFLRKSEPPGIYGEYCFQGKKEKKKKGRRAFGSEEILSKLLFKIFNGTTISWGPGVFSADYLQTVITKF